MSYRLHPDERLPAGLARITYEQIDDALDDLRHPDDVDAAVHESRKLFKKVRGLLRLVRLELGEPVFQRENACFRDAGRLLADLRDARVFVKTLDDLLEEHADVLTAAAYADLRQAFVDAYAATRQQTVDVDDALSTAAGMIADARARVPGWPLNRHAFAAVSGGLKKVYKRGRNRMADAADEPEAENFHEWRKRVKYLWYNVRILRPAWEEPLDELADEIHLLSDDLGDAHDLAEMQNQIAAHASTLSTAAHDALLGILKQEQARLRAAAFSRGRRIYAEKPGQFVDRLAAYWDAWQA